MKIMGAFVLGSLLFGGTVFGQDEGVDPFNSIEWQKGDLLAKAPESWEVMLEVFSLPFTEAAQLRREVKDHGQIYAELVKRADGGKAKLEEFAVLKIRVGAEGVMESIEEYVYPTEFEPPELPNIVKKVPDNPEVAAMLISPATPTAFETRNLGLTMELENMSKVAPDTIETFLKFCRVDFVERIAWGRGPSTAEMPTLESQKRALTVTLKSGSPTLVGTMSPPRSEKQAGNDRRVHLAFATTKPSGK